MATQGEARRVLVTGGGSGIGRAAALLMARQGMRVVVADLDDLAGRSLEADAADAEGSVTYRRADVSREAEVERLVQDAQAVLGGVDALVHSAGIMAGQMLDIREFDEATWDRVVDINLKGAFLVTKHVARVMVPAGTGAIILVASKAGVSVGSGSYAYGASKGGVHGLALTLDRHLRPLGIRVNDVCPGDVDTPLMRRSLAEATDRGADPQAIAALRAGLTSADEIAELLAFLASEAASSVRGTIFTA